MVNNKNNSRWVDFFIITLIFVMPFVLYWNEISQGTLMVLGDGPNFFVPHIFQFNEISSGEIPLWNGYVIAGIPLFADPNNSYFYPFHVLALFFSPTTYTNLFFVLHMGLAGFFSYLFLKQTTGNRFVGLAGAIAFSMSIIIGGLRKEHGWIYSTIVWLPLILYFIQLYIDTDKKRNLIFSAFAMTMQFFAGSPQYALYSNILAFFYLLYFLLNKGFPIKNVLKLLLLWAGSYLLFSAVFLVPIAELIIQSSRRAADYFCLFSSSWELLLMTAFPYVFGKNVFHPLGRYASAEISIELYLGIVPLIYALYAMRYYSANRHIRFYMIAIVVTFIYASSCNLPYLGGILHRFPILGLFNVQSRILFIFVISGIFCFAYGISELKNSEHVKRLLYHSFLMAVAIVLFAAIASAVGRYSDPRANSASYYSMTSSTFGVSIVIAWVNLLLVGVLFLVKEKKSIFGYTSAIVIVILLGVTSWDVGRFSLVYAESQFDALMNTGETRKLQRLLDDEPYRVITSYNQIYRGDYQKSGLVDNWSMVNKIRNIKGRSEFQDPRLNELLDQAESRDSANTNWLITENSILSMLSVRYVLLPSGAADPKAIPSLPEAVLLNMKDPIIVPGDGLLFIHSTPIPVEVARYYQIEFDIDMDTPNSDVRLFYVDFYGGLAFDQEKQQKDFTSIKDDKAYSIILYMGDARIPSEVSFRIVCISETPITIKNLRVTRLVPASVNPEYVLVSQTSRYDIYENKQAQKLLYIPDRVESIQNDASLRKNPEDYPDMNRISYVQDYKDLVTGGNLNIISIKNNSVTARVNSETTTFVNHAQSFYPGWKAYIDEQRTQIRLVNGVIQGVEVPPGEHIVEFVYAPLSLQVAATISTIALLIAIGFIVYEANGHNTGPY